MTLGSSNSVLILCWHFPGHVLFPEPSPVFLPRVPPFSVLLFTLPLLRVPGRQEWRLAPLLGAAFSCQVRMRGLSSGENCIPSTLWCRSVAWFVSSDGWGDDLVICLELKGWRREPEWPSTCRIALEGKQAESDVIYCLIELRWPWNSLPSLTTSGQLEVGKWQQKMGLFGGLSWAVDTQEKYCK